MPTNDERRKIAAKLRELPIDMYDVEERWEAEGLGTDCHDQTDYSLIHNVLFGCLPAEHMHPCDYDELHHRLAELIEPEERTCHMRDTRWDDGQCTWGCICSECGARREHESGRWFNFCPNCGARVVE